MRAPERTRLTTSATVVHSPARPRRGPRLRSGSMPVHLFELKKTAFVLWRPFRTETPPALVIGRFEAGNPPALADRRRFPMRVVEGTRDLWAIDASACGLTEGLVYHYWFEVNDSSPSRDGSRILCTDPTASTVDWRLLAERLPEPYTTEDQDPASVVALVDGELVPCDPAGEIAGPVAP